MASENIPIINPHFKPSTTTICDQLTSEQFQQKLYTWLEDKGLITDLRKYLRVQMIQQLRYTTLNKNNNDCVKIQHVEQYSLKQQAFNLLIGEYLLYNGCYYTLSVFNMETPSIINQFPISLFEIDKRTHNNDHIRKFNCDTIDNILELIGISKNNQDYNRIRMMYLKNANKSLLCCVISNKFKNNRKISNNNNIKNGENLMEYFHKFLSNFGISKPIIQDFCKNVQHYVFNDIEKINKYHQKRYNELIKELSKKDEEFHKTVEENFELRNEQQLLKQQINVYETRKTIIDKNCEQEHCQEICRINVEKIKQLHNEIDNLHEINNKKLLEIERLTMTVDLFEKQLNTAQMKINLLNNCLQQTANFNAIQFDQATTTTDNNKQSPNFDLTDDILQAFRNRLQQLEQENDVAEAEFKQLKL